MPERKDHYADKDVGKDEKCYWDNAERWAKEDATTGSDNRKVGPDGIVLEKFKDIRSIPAGAHAPATGHTKK